MRLAIPVAPRHEADFDGNAFPNGSFTFSGYDALSDEVSIMIENDGASEDTETFKIRVTGGTSTPKEVAIIDDDDSPGMPQPVPPVVVGFDARTYRVNEASGTVELTVSVISGNLTETIRLSYAVSDVSTTVSDDYTVSGDTLELSLMTPSVTISVDIRDDMSDEPEEKFTVELSGAPAGITLDPATATVTITDNDDEEPATSLPTISLEVPDVVFENDLALHDLTATLSGMVMEEVAVKLVVGPDSTAELIADYTLLDNPGVIEPGQVTARFRLYAPTDMSHDGDKHLVLTPIATIGTTEVMGVSRTITIRDIDPPPTLSITTDSFETTEPAIASNFSIEVELNNDLETDLLVSLKVISSSTAEEGEDFRLLDAVTIDAGSTVGDDSPGLQILPDSIYEGEEYIVLEVTTNDPNVRTPSRITITIKDDDEAPAPSVSFVEASSMIAEDAANPQHSIGLRLSGDLMEETTVTFTVAGSATRGMNADYILTATTVTIPELTRDAVIQLDVNNDDLYDGRPHETVVLTLTSATGGAIVDDTKSEHTVTITDDEDVPTVTLSPAASIREGMAGLVTATLDIASDRTITVELTPSHTDAKPADYSTPTTLIAMIPPGEFTATFTIMATPDGIYEGPEMLEFTLSVVGGGAGVTEPRSRQLLILDADPVPSISFGATMSEIEENAANRRHGVGLKLSGPLEDEIEVTFTVAGSATRNADYTLAADTVTIQAGDKDRIILLDVNNDDLYDGRPHETVVLRLVSATGGVTVNDTKSEHTVTITDDEDAPMVTLDPISPSVREGGVAIFMVNLSHGVDEAVTLELAVSNGSSENEDYARPDSETQLSVTIGAGETTGTLSLKTNGDNVYEGDETVELSLSATSGAENVMGLPISRELTITEENEPPVLSLSGPSTVSENDASVVFTATLSGALLEANLEVELAVVGGDAVLGGTAGAGDYTLSPAQATIQGGQREVEFTLETNDNEISYGDKTVELELRRVSGPVVPLGVVKRTLTIEEDEAVPQLSLQEIASIREGMAGLVTATLDIASGRTITVELTPSHTDAKPADYSTPTTLIAMIPPGEFTATFTIMATSDKIYEGPEMLEFTLSVVGGGAVVTEPRSRQLLILDADPVPSISFVATTSTIEEDAANQRHGVGLELSGVLEDEIEVTFTVAGSATRSGINADYTLAATTVTIPAETPDAIILLDVNNDDLYDGAAETVILTLTSATGDVTVGTPSVHTVTITDDEDAPTVTLSPATPSVTEGERAVFTVTLSHGVDEALALELAVSDGSSEEDEDYDKTHSETQLSVTIGAGETTGELSLKTNVR